MHRAGLTRRVSERSRNKSGGYLVDLQTGVRLPEGASAALAKPTKYHYYPHNQHIYLLPECAVQQVCNAVYVRLNFTQPLCACPGRYRDPCSASLDSDDLHTTELVTDPRTKVSRLAFYPLYYSFIPVLATRTFSPVRCFFFSLRFSRYA